MAKQHYHVHTPNTELIFPTKKEAQEWVREYFGELESLGDDVDREYEAHLVKEWVVPCRKACKLEGEE